MMKNNKITETSEEPTTKPLKTNIPDNPFDEVDVSDEYESEELTYKQNVLFKKFLIKNNFTDFNHWWNSEGKERMSEYISEVRMTMSEKDFKDEDKWWEDYIRNNLEMIKDRLVFCHIWGDTV